MSDRICVHGIAEHRVCLDCSEWYRIWQEPQCSLCEAAPSESKHHLIPKCFGGKDTEGLCTDCHAQIHAVLTNKELLLEFCSIEKLKEFDKIQNWIKWRKKHPNIKVKHKMSKQIKKYGNNR